MLTGVRVQATKPANKDPREDPTNYEASKQGSSRGSLSVQTTKPTSKDPREDPPTILICVKLISRWVQYIFNLHEDMRFNTDLVWRGTMFWTRHCWFERKIFSYWIHYTSIPCVCSISYRWPQNRNVWVECYISQDLIMIVLLSHASSLCFSR